MFRNGIFTTVMFLDYDKAYVNNPDGYVYAYTGSTTTGATRSMTWCRTPSTSTSPGCPATR